MCGTYARDVSFRCGLGHIVFAGHLAPIAKLSRALRAERDLLRLRAASLAKPEREAKAQADEWQRLRVAEVDCGRWRRRALCAERKVCKLNVEMCQLKVSPWCQEVEEVN